MNTSDPANFELFDSTIIKRYGALLWQWSWLVLLMAALGGGGVFFYSRAQTPIYQTTTRILISRPAQEQSSDLTRALSSQQILDTYIQFARLAPVVQDVASMVGAPVYSNMIYPSSVGTTQIMQINVQHPDPDMTVKIANALVKVLISKSDEIQSGRYSEVESSLNVQIQDMENQLSDTQEKIDLRTQELVQEQRAQVESLIVETQGEIATTQQQISVLTNETSLESQTQLIEARARVSQLQALLNSYQQTYTTLVALRRTTVTNDPELSRLEKTLTLYQQIYLNLINNRESVRLAKLQNSVNVAQIEKPARPAAPISPTPLADAILGGLAGLVLAIVIIFLIDFMDDTLKSADEVRRLLKLNVIGHIGQFDSEHSGGLFVDKNPRAPVSESFRTLRTSLEFAGVDRPLKTIMVTSAGPGEGKTTIAVNLAGILAQSGKKILLIDTDLRRPNVHRPLELTNRFGLTDVFRGVTSLEEVIQTYRGQSGASFEVITTGAIPPNPAELIASEKMAELLRLAAQRADILIVDSAPLMVTDAQLLSPRVDGTIIVLHTGVTRAEATRYSVEQLTQTGGRILGVVLNRVQPRHSSYGTHYAPYYYRKSVYFENQPGRWQRFVDRLFPGRNARANKTGDDE